MSFLLDHFFLFKFFFFIFFFFFFSSVYFYLFDLVLYFDWVYYSHMSCSFSLIFLFDWMSMIFMSFVFLVSGCVLLYSLDYMSGDMNLVRFYYIVFFFILSMLFLITMPDFFCLLLGWDGLGVVSYCLVIYYQNKVSLTSGFLTLIINRLGDIFIIFSVCWCFNFGYWHYMYFYSWLNYDSFVVFFFLFFSCLTKSAQIPFSSWLPAAMAAPTPVSSLVHSSTLVTAGVYLMIRFNFFLIGDFSFFLMLISLVTIFMSGISALFENDLSKIIALSTLSQLGFMFFCLSLGNYYLGFFHLLMHAVYKSMLFLCSGFFIHCHGGYQDIRFMGGLGVQSPFISSCFFLSLISLAGFPFLCGFYSKDFILELLILSNLNFFFFFFFFVGLFLTFFYSLRLLYYLFFGGSFFFSFLEFSDLFMMSFSLFFLFFFCVVGGSLIFWFFDGLYIYVFDFYFSIFPLFFFFFFFFFLDLFYYNSFGLYHFLKFFFCKMWFLPYYSSFFFLNMFFNLSGYLFHLVDHGWTEYFLGSWFILFYRSLSSLMDLFSVNYFNLIFFFFFFFLGGGLYFV
nr:NADH dehydrogenase subunit 5 [Borysthenes sp. 2 WQW-2023a]